MIDAAGVALVAAALLLVAAAPGHRRHPRVLEATLHRHGVLPSDLRAGASRVLPWVELAVGSVTVVAWPTASVVGGGLARVAVTAAAGATAVVYLGFAAYSAVAVRAAPGAPCACLGTSEPLTWLVPARALLFASAAVVVLMGGVPSGASGEVVLLTVLAAVLVALLAWAIPTVAAPLPSSEHESGHDHR